MQTYAGVFWGALLLALLLTPLLIAVGTRWNLTDRPGPRKIHTRAVPRIGGIAIFFPTLGLTIAACLLRNDVGKALREIAPSLAGVFGAATLLFVVGLWDDVRGLRARYKLAAQVAGGLILLMAGAEFSRIRFTDQWVLHLGWLSVPLTILWFVAITNAVNLIDGLDGLAAGIALITCATLAGFALYAGTRVLAVPVLALLGGLTGFLVFNFNPARIFLGDSGSLFLGAMLAGLSVLTAHKTSTVVAVALPLLALGVPIFDTALSFLRRLLQGRSPFAPDRGHIHHKLLEMGLDQRRAVLVLYGATVVLVGLGMTLLVLRNAGMLFVIGLATALLAVLFHVTGTFQAGRTLSAMASGLRKMRLAGNTKEAFERMWVRLADDPSLETLWSVLVSEAGTLGIVTMELLPRARSARPPRTWSGVEGYHDHVSIDLQVRDPGAGPARLTILLSAADGLEQAAQRAAVLAKLIESFPAVVHGTGKAGRVVSGHVGVGNVLPALSAREIGAHGGDPGTARAGKAEA